MTKDAASNGPGERAAVILSSALRRYFVGQQAADGLFQRYALRQDLVDRLQVGYFRVALLAEGVDQRDEIHLAAFIGNQRHRERLARQWNQRVAVEFGGGVREL